MVRRFIFVTAALVLLSFPLAAWAGSQPQKPGNLQQLNSLDGTWSTKQPQNNRGKINKLTFEIKPNALPGSKGYRGWAVDTAGKKKMFYWKPGRNGTSIAATSIPGYPGTQYFYIHWINAKTIRLTEPSSHFTSKWVKR